VHVVVTRLVRRRRHAGTDAERGAVLVEAALVLPVFLLFVFGIIEMGLYMSASATTTSATRSGARYASANFGVSLDEDAAHDVRDIVTDDLDALHGNDAPVKLYIYRATTDGFPWGQTDFDDCPLRCYRYTWNGSEFDYEESSPGWSSPDACISEDDSELDSIGVYVEVRHQFITGYLGSFLGDDSLLAEKTVSQLEPLPLSQCADE
jgi:hypothetical protein